VGEVSAEEEIRKLLERTMIFEDDPSVKVDETLLERLGLSGCIRAIQIWVPVEDSMWIFTSFRDPDNDIVRGYSINLSQVLSVESYSTKTASIEAVRFRLDNKNMCVYVALKPPPEEPPIPWRRKKS
jgi:hypothetical protein